MGDYKGKMEDKVGASEHACIKLSTNRQTWPRVDAISSSLINVVDTVGAWESEVRRVQYIHVIDALPNWQAE
jgi:hypothetical protein